MVQASYKIYTVVVFVGKFIIKDINVVFNKKKEKAPIQFCSIKRKKSSYIIAAQISYILF
ncbi:MAG TPA: hypothetical protein DCR67_11735 [Brevibacillus sp.]|nr:hypothetical protein [Brevibacillus sp.]